MLRRLLLTLLATVTAMAGLLAPSAANAATAATCTSGVSVSQFAFNPSSIPVNGTSGLTLVLQNCGTQAVSGSTVWYGQYTGQSCPVIDPPPGTPFTIAAGASYTLTNTYGSAGGSCVPTSLTIHANVNVTGVGTVTTTTATLQFTPACTGNGIAVDQFSFNPASVTGPDQTSTLTLVLQNCTGQAVAGSSDWYPSLTGTGTGLPPGCPHLDPIAFTYTMAAGATFTQTFGFSEPSTSTGCQATGLSVTANVYENGVTAVAATATASLVITQPASNGCHVTYTPSNWQGGFTANVTIADNGTSAINGWALTFTFPGDQKITNAWNATVTQSGSSVTATNLSYNAAIAPGASQSFGFQGTWSASDASPIAFSVNGAPCA